MLLSCEGEEAGTVHAVRRRVEVLAKELKELRQVLWQGASLIDAELLQERRRHQHYWVRVEAAAIRFVQLVLRQHLLDYQHDVP